MASKSCERRTPAGTRCDAGSDACLDRFDASAHGRKFVGKSAFWFCGRRRGFHFSLGAVHRTDLFPYRGTRRLRRDDAKVVAPHVRLYGYHALLLAFAFLVAVPIASHGDRPGLHNLLDFYFMAGAKQAVTEAALLIYRPPLLDILPMYIIFLMFTSMAIPLARNIGWKPILWTSFAFWVLAQFGFRAPNTPS